VRVARAAGPLSSGHIGGCADGRGPAVLGSRTRRTAVEVPAQYVGSGIDGVHEAVGSGEQGISGGVIPGHGGSLKPAQRR
jgi:hypothetical protein